MNTTCGTEIVYSEAEAAALEVYAKQWRTAATFRAYAEAWTAAGSVGDEQLD